MGKSGRKLKLIEGRKRGTDEEILNQYKHGMFLHQIQGFYKIGLTRLRRITREYDERKGNE